MIVTVRDSELVVVAEKNSTQEADEVIKKGIDALNEHEKPAYDDQVSNASIQHIDEQENAGVPQFGMRSKERKRLT